MRNKTKLLIGGMLAIAMIFVLAACAPKTEKGDMTGTVVMALGDSMIVDCEDETVNFTTSPDTKYYLGDGTKLSIGDTVNVKYHTERRKTIADRISIVKYAKYEQKFSGKVSDVKSYEFTVTEDNTTVTFIKNDVTIVKGDLSVGDEVDVVYTGNISEHPFATEITVTKDVKEEPKISSITGFVSEYTDKSLLVSVDSATSYRFKVDKDTKITGVAKKIEAGQSVKVFFTGDLKKEPAAKEVNIVKEAERRVRNINGTVKDVTDKKITLDTGKKTYDIARNKGTRYTGDKLTKGYTADITYLGTLGKDAEAVNVYCVKNKEEKIFYKVTFNDGNGNDIKVEEVEKGKSATAPANPTRSGYTFKGWDKDFSKVERNMTVTAKWAKNAAPEKKDEAKPDNKPEPTPTPEPTPEPEVKTYKVTFDDGQGNTLKTEDVEEGKAATAPEDPTRDGYTFDGWDKDFSNVTSDMSVSAKWKENEAQSPTSESKLNQKLLLFL